MEQQKLHLPESAFSYPNFQRYWAARLCITLAIQMQAVAIGWQVYDLTRNPLDLGLVGLAQFLPSLGLALITGHVADRYDRRRVLVVCIVVVRIVDPRSLCRRWVSWRRPAPMGGISCDFTVPVTLDFVDQAS